jgi:hypothetical protein
VAITLNPANMFGGAPVASFASVAMGRLLKLSQ